MNTSYWYALRVRSNAEHKAHNLLESMGYNVFLPTYRVRRKWSDRMKDLTLPLFSGYLFCFMDINNRLPVLQAPGVLNVVGCGKILTPIPEDQIAAVRRMVSSTLA